MTNCSASPQAISERMTLKIYPMFPSTNSMKSNTSLKSIKLSNPVKKYMAEIGSAMMQLKQKFKIPTIATRRHLTNASN